MNDRVSILDQYRSKAKIAAEAVPSLTGGREYKAYGIQPPRTRSTDLRINYGDGRIGLMSKSYRTEALLTSHQHLSLIFNDCIITLEGRHLDQLIELIQDDELRSLHCFNPKIHDAPTDDEILITRIDRRTTIEVLATRKEQITT